MTTISNSTTVGIVLTSPADTNPIVIVPGVTVSNAGIALDAPSGYWTIQNSGTIASADSYGVNLSGGGVVNNAASGSITGGNDGVLIFSAGSVSNAASAAITGYNAGVVVIFGTGTVVNSGSIAATATAGHGVLLLGGVVSNAASASITGYRGADLASGGTVTNAGTINGTGGTAVSFGGVSGNRLVVDPGAVFNGKVAGSTSATNTLELASGGGIGTLSGLGTSFVNFGTVIVDSGASWELKGANPLSGSHVADNGTLTNAGTISGAVAVNSGGALTNAAGGTITFGGLAVVYGLGRNVVNSGSIAGTGGGSIGIYLQNGGSVTNATSGSISGDNGVRIAGVYGGVGTVVNSGSIYGSAFGVYLGNGGSVTNAASASARSHEFGVYLVSGGTVTNAGTIAGTVGAIGFRGTGNNLLVVEPGAVFGGNIVGYRSASNAIELASGGGIGTFTGLGTSFTNFGTVTVDSGATWKLTGANTIAAGVHLIDDGALINAGTLFGGVPVASGGTLTNASSGTISGPVMVSGGAALTNASGATITNGGQAAVYGVGGAGTVVNSGSIAGASLDGVYLKAGGSLTNATSGSISGGQVGIDLIAGGSITNAASASIAGGFFGIEFVGSAGTVVNSGSIAGGIFDGIYLKAGGSVTNAASASIIGGGGVYVVSGGTVMNAGTITGTGGTAVDFRGTASNLLVVAPGAVFNGNVVGSTSAGNAMELASGSGIGTLAGLGTIFTNFNSVTVDSGSAWEFKGADTITAGASLVNDGTLTLSGASLSDAGSLVNNGEIALDPSTLTVANMSGSGSVTISSGSTLDVVSGLAGNVSVSGGGTLVVSSGATASGTVVSSGGTVDVFGGGTLAGAVANDGTVNFDIAGSATFSGTLTGAGTLVVSGGGHLDVLSAYLGAAQIDDASTLEFTSAYVGVATFSGSPTGSGGTLKLDAPSTGPINVANPNDAVIGQPGGDNWIDAAVSYTLPANIDTLFLFAGAHGTGNSDASGDALYALDTVNTQTLTGNSPNDAFVIDSSSDVVVPKAGSHDVVYAAASYTLPTGVDTLFLEGAAAQGAGNTDASGDALFAANPGQVATLTGNSANDVFVVYNSADVVVPKAGSHDSVYSAVNYALPTGVDVLFLEAGTQGAGNSDASGDALYAADAGIAQTLTGNSANDAFVVYNSADVVVPKAGGHDSVYSAVNYTLPTGVDTLFLEADTQGAGNSDAVGDVLYAADAGIAQTLTGHSHNDSFVVYNSADTVIGQAGSSDTVYAAANFTLPTNVDTLFLEGNASRGTGNSDAVDALFGNSGVAGTLVAGSGADVLFVTGTAGTTLTGGAGHDTFAFPNVMGHDEVTNFGTPKDTLQFNATLFANFTAAINAASQVGANTVFTIDTNDTLTLDNVTKASLTASNFHFS